MNKQVEGMVKRVRLTPAEIDTCYMEAAIPKKGYVENTKAIAKYTAEYQLNKVLNDPDLAFIDSRQEYDKILIGVLVSLQDRLDADKDLAEIKAIGYVVGILESIIPLAEELGETFVTDEKDQLARAQYAYETGHPERELESTKRGE